MAELTKDEDSLVKELSSQATSLATRDKRNLAYYDGANRLTHLGISVPPKMQVLEVVVNWPRVVVEAIGERSDVKTIRRGGALGADEDLLELFDANNLDAQMVMFNRDKHVFGRAFLSVGSNEDDGDFPLITVESPREMTVKVDRRSRRIAAAFKQVQEPASLLGQMQTFGVLYLPDRTVWLKREGGGWKVEDRDQHDLGRVPVIMALNRQRTGMWTGRSEMADVIPISDAAVRTLTNLQLGLEAAALPRKWVIGASENDFVDRDGNPITKWESYFSSVWALANENAKIGQMPGADLSGFHDTVYLYGRLAASVTGFPASYFGHVTGNPPQEGAIRAEEARLVKTVERSNGESGKALAWALDTAERFRTGEWPAGNRTVVEWHDPGTPTVAQRADALQKMAGGVPILSREGAWDEMGWSEPRMQRERERFEMQDADPAIQALITKAESLG